MVSTSHTYGRLAQILEVLGFVRRDRDPFPAFSEAAHGAIIVLPLTDPDDRVRAHHLIAVRTTLEGKGVASAERFHRMLTARPPTRVASHRVVLKASGTSKRQGKSAPTQPLAS